MWTLAMLAATSMCTERVVIVVPTVSGGDRPSLSQLYTEAETALSARACVRPLRLESAFAFQEEALVDRCGADEACVRDAVAKSEAIRDPSCGRPGRTALGRKRSPSCFAADRETRHALLVAVVRAGARIVVNVRLLDTISTDVYSRTETLRAERSSETRETIRATIEAVLDAARFAHAARLSVTADPPQSTVTLVADDATTTIAGPAMLPAGRYRVEVTAPGHVTSRQEIDLAEGDRSSLTVTLDEDVALTQRWWFWAGVGAVVAAGAVTAAVALQPGRSCFCSASEAQCATLCSEL